MEWVRYYVATGNLSEAKRLLWDGKNPAPPGAGWFRCCYNPAPPAGGADRAEKFRAAIVAYDFAEAERLAATAEEKEDVSLSQARAARPSPQYTSRATARLTSLLSLPRLSGASSGFRTTSPNATSTRRRTRRSSRARRI